MKIEQIYNTAFQRFIDNVNLTLQANSLPAVKGAESYSEFYNKVKETCTTDKINEEQFQRVKEKWILPYKANGEICTEINFQFSDYKDLYIKSRNLCRVLSPVWETVLPLFCNFVGVTDRWNLMREDLHKFQNAYRPFLEAYNTHILAGEKINKSKFERDRKNILSQIKRCSYIQLDIEHSEIVDVWVKVPTRRFPLPEILLPIFRERTGLHFDGDMKIRYSEGKTYNHIYKCIVEVAESFNGFYDAVNGKQRNTFRGKEIERLHPLYKWFRKYSKEWDILRISFPELVEILLDFPITDSGNEYRYRTEPKWDTGIRVATL